MKENKVIRLIAWNIRRSRNYIGASQEEFAKLVGLTRVSISNIEAGRQVCTLKVLYKISNITGIPMSEFFNEIQLNQPNLKLPSFVFELDYKLHKRLHKLPKKALYAFLKMYKDMQEIKFDEE